ncbi:hypothetical protein [Geopsychrobacter electrodiphilus]|uniref:hypothetical protein n=1 Tax=Geopsychrobacter electrodiphilus TaxID=225196 RepID=UPI00036AF7DD|nr:hypothetical protein [Geopsychrobacter electrodiphilus]
MLGLLIKDKIRWQDKWSAEFGQRFGIHDSTDNLFIFEDGCTSEEIMAVIGKVPKGIYELFEVEASPKDQCDYMADSGQCFNRTEC